jgi:hypothetical protein
LEIKVDPKGSWQLVFRVLDAFNYTTRFRALLAEIAQALEQDAQTDLQQPAFEEN